MKNFQVGIAEPFQRHFFTVTEYPFVIGSGDGCDWQILEQGVLEKHCSFEILRNSLVLQRFGKSAKRSQVVPGRDYALHLGNLFLVVHLFKRNSPGISQKWADQILDDCWWLGLVDKSRKEKGGADGPYALDDIAGMVQGGMIDPEQYKLYPGKCRVGFRLAALNFGSMPASHHQVDEWNQGLTQQSAIPMAIPAAIPQSARASALHGQSELPPLPTAFPQDGAMQGGGMGGWNESGSMNPSMATNQLAEYVSSELNFENSDKGDFICPTCWLQFDAGDVMHVAVHDHCYGDPVLGEDAKLRFHANQFNDAGQALDPFGIPCTETACPYCRRVLPAGFLDVQHMIFSIVGAPQAGKSYFISVLTRLLQQTLYNDFGISFRDADATGNAPLNEMKATLFGAKSPEAAFLAKTVLEGSMYESLPRFGKMVSLPRPFVFALSSNNGSPDNDCGVVFYDNAGEHFLPGADSSDSPGTQHLARAHSIFFLYDPMSSVEFRSRFADHPDPQFHADMPDNQDVILAESEIRIKKLLGLSRREQISTPMAVVIGKCDAWIDSLGRESLKPVLLDGAIDCSAVEHNSIQIRNFMLDICPHIVSNAERLSNQTKYFAVSSFGHTPVQFSDSQKNQRIGPDPKKLDPMFVEIPFLWALSQLKPELIPSFS